MQAIPFNDFMQEGDDDNVFEIPEKQRLNALTLEQEQYHQQSQLERLNDLRSGGLRQEISAHGEVKQHQMLVNQ